MSTEYELKERISEYLNEVSSSHKNEYTNAIYLLTKKYWFEQFKAQEQRYSLEDVRNMINMCLDQLNQPFEGRDDFINELVCHYSEKPKAQEQRYSLEDVWKILKTIQDKGLTTTPFTRDWVSAKKDEINQVINSIPKAKEQKPISIDKLTEIRNSLYDNLPTGQIDAFQLTSIIAQHLKVLDKFIDEQQAALNR